MRVTAKVLVGAALGVALGYAAIVVISCIGNLIVRMTP